MFGYLKFRILVESSDAGIIPRPKLYTCCTNLNPNHNG